MQSVAEIEASPEVQDLRNRVSGFLNELIYPNEKILERGGDEACAHFQSNPGRGEKARAVGTGPAERNRRRRTRVHALRVRQ